MSTKDKLSYDKDHETKEYAELESVMMNFALGSLED